MYLPVEAVRAERVAPIKATVNKDRDSAVAKILAAEDVRRGDFVGILHEVAEYPSFYWCGDALIPDPEQPVRVRWRPLDGGTPLKVRSICLPFVLVMAPSQEHRTLDVRQCELVRLQRDYAEAAWKSLKKRARGSSRS